MVVGNFPYVFSPGQAGVNVTVDPAITNPIRGQFLPFRTIRTFSSHWLVMRLDHGKWTVQHIWGVLGSAIFVW